MEIQVRLPIVLYAIYTFTRDHDPEFNEDNCPNINYEIHHQGGGGGCSEAEGLGEDNAEGAATRL